MRVTSVSWGHSIGKPRRVNSEDTVTNCRSHGAGLLYLLKEAILPLSCHFGFRHTAEQYSKNVCSDFLLSAYVFQGPSLTESSFTWPLLRVQESWHSSPGLEFQLSQEAEARGSLQMQCRLQLHRELEVGQGHTWKQKREAEGWGHN